MFVYDFGARLKELRKKKNLSQYNVAAYLDLSRTTISAYECNIKTPSLDVIIKLARLYNTSIDYIVGLDNRFSIELDDLPPKKQKVITEVVEILKKDYTN